LLNKDARLKKKNDFICENPKVYRELKRVWIFTYIILLENKKSNLDRSLAFLFICDYI